jgi:hypothetical protein
MVKMSDPTVPPTSAMSNNNKIKTLQAYLNNKTNGKTLSKPEALIVYKQLNPSNAENITNNKVSAALEQLKGAAVAAQAALPPRAPPPGAPEGDAVVNRNYTKWNTAKTNLQTAINKINNKPGVRNALTKTQFNAINSVIKTYGLNIKPLSNSPQPGRFSRFFGGAPK